MRTNRQITTALLVAAFAAVGCSKPFEDSQTKTQQQPLPSSPAQPLAVPNAVDSKDEEGTGGDVAARSAGPVSFAGAEAAYQAKKYREAATLFDQYTERRPGNAWGHFMLGLSAWKAGDLATAEGAFEAALRIDAVASSSAIHAPGRDRWSRRAFIRNPADDLAVAGWKIGHPANPTTRNAPRSRRRVWPSGTRRWPRAHGRTFCRRPAMA